MLRDDGALEALERLTASDEKGQSAYWRSEVRSFEVKADGTVEGASVLGMVSRKTGPVHAFLHWLLQAPFRRMGRRFAALSPCLAIGRQIARRQGRAYTYDLLRHGLTLALLRQFDVLPGADGVSAVIGDGYGMMASHLLIGRPESRVISVNLTKPLLLDLVFIRQAVPGIGIAFVRDRAEMAEALADPAIRCVAVRADDAEALRSAPVALAVNIVSMQEMTPKVIAGYFDILRNNQAARTAFYCCNKLHKRLSDGTEVVFRDYPWRADGDQTLLDEPCAWSQWVYSKTPPFWHHRSGQHRVIWHRLAWLARG